MNPENKIKGLSRAILILSAILLAANIFLPIWKIQLWAPQYPEGLALLIYANKLAGDVDIINGLNHYIGMQTLHAENFIEFSILRYILGFFVAFILVTALIGRKKAVYVLFIIFVLFSILAMVDFYRWNYNYGHHLDPKAAIKVPGMSYQPPLIGYKKLLNFGAYSMPDIGGILFMASVLLVLVVILIEKNVFTKLFKRKTASTVAAVILVFISFTSCTLPGPRPIKLNADNCDNCKMTLTNEQYATQIVTVKGRQYVFDDLACMVAYTKSHAKADFLNYYIADFAHPSEFIDVDHAVLLQSDSLHSPMGGNIIGFENRDSAKYYQVKLNAKKVTWTELSR
ncbi:MAG: nitrous oxide reductase accessory protein NosL [Saprospiraceae bacterium]